MILADSPCTIVMGTAVQTRNVGFGFCTMTLAVATSELVAFFAVSVYFVEVVGATVKGPDDAFTVPGLTPTSAVIVALSAFSILQLSTELCPPWIVLGSAINNRICTLASTRVVTLTRADADRPSVFRTVSRKIRSSPADA